MEKIIVDFHNTDIKGRVRLNLDCTKEYFKNNSTVLIEGKEIILDDDDELFTIGIIKYSDDEDIWVAEVDWDNIKNKNPSKP